MRRGFKTWAEKLAIEQRRLLALKPEDPLPARLLADFHDATIVEPVEIPGITQEILDSLLGIGSDGWSAVSFERNGCTIIIHNPDHSSRRQESDLMHEMAHVLCNHQPSHLVQSLGLPFTLRTYNPNQEDEAVWLGGCLQLPRDGLLWALRRGMTDAMMVNHFGASIDQVRYRCQVTGVRRQVKKWHAR